MSHIETCIKLAAYLLCIGIALEIAHKLYWKTNDWILNADIPSLYRALLGMIGSSIPLTATIGVTAAFINAVDSKSLATLGLSYNGESLIKLAFGAGIAFGCVAISVLIGIALGYIELHRSRLSEDCYSCIPMFFGGLVDFFSGAVFEEIIFRGYVYYLLYDNWGAWPAAYGSAIIFTIAHLIKHPGAPAMFAINAFIFGLLAALARQFTGALWLPIGLHFGWNVVSGPIFGLPYSGKSYERGVVQSDVKGPEWLTGGMYSMDAGALGTFSLMIAAIGLSAVAPIC